MAESGFVFESGKPIDIGSPIENDYVEESGELVSDGDESDFVFISGRGLGAGLSPKVIYDASRDGVLLSDGTEASGGEAIDEWVDSQSGKNVTGGSPVRVDDALNGNPIVRFDGANGSDYLDIASDGLTYEQPFSIVAVPVTIANRDAYTEFVVDRHPSSSEGVTLRYRNTPEEWAMVDDAGNTINAGTNAQAPVLLTAVYDGDNSVLREDGSQSNSGTMETDLKGVRIGNNADGDRSMGDLAEVRIYNENIVETGKVDSVESEVASTWGLSI